MADIKTMFNEILNKKRQNSVSVDGVEYKINTHYTPWLIFGREYDDYKKGKNTNSAMPLTYQIGKNKQYLGLENIFRAYIMAKRRCFMDDIIYFLATSAGTIFLIAIPLVVVIIAVLTLLAINHLHKIPDMQKSLENCEKYLKYLAVEKKKGETEKSPPSEKPLEGQ